ncbi:permease [Leptolinea tardivitalis]|uniref:Permease n=2 Tax=Leptolinea tardivitalis TaxID=229920 RepID=A0A0P6WZ31_9CHLR|nr:permease [Leptolinea tardivitalis]
MLFGRPLATADAPDQTIGKAIGLAVFSSDALSSVAYAPQEMLIILAAAGTTAFGISVPLAFAICILLVILTLSYEQTIHAYPGGGGAYIVSRDNLGEMPAQIAAAALLTDYILTVAVSVSSGVAQVTSAFPDLLRFKVEIGVAMVLLIMMINLRGVKESGYAFAVPTYFFLVSMFITIGFGLFRYLTGTLGQVVDPPRDFIDTQTVLQPITLFLILKAFASGTTALTGVEAISNGIMAFKEPRSSNAGKTLILMAAILGSMMLGITFLANHIGALPSDEETLISQLARTAFDSRGIFYLMVITATTVILVMAANTAFADFPRLSALVGKDGFLPRQLAFRGSRLVYSRGIVVLAGIASLLIIIFQASVTKLIPLYAIGVFLSFTLSQAGMAHRWWKSGKLKPGEEIVEKGSTIHHDDRWLFKMIVNGFGSVCTLVVMAVFAITKFTDGAYVVIILLPVLVYIFYSIHRHYRNLAQRLSMDTFVSAGRISRHRVILPIGGVHRGTLAALRYAKTLSDDITAVHVSIDEEETTKIKQKWEIWGDGTRLVILESPYRVFIEPLLKYIDEIDETRQANDIITIVVPEFVPRHMMSNALHTQTAVELRMALRFRKDIVITNVPYQVD